MKIVIAPRARRDLANQLGYLVDQGAMPAARSLERRLTNFLNNTVACYPRSGTFVAYRELWETWVPRTRFVIWYRFTADALQIVRVWHASQNRHRP